MGLFDQQPQDDGSSFFAPQGYDGLGPLAGNLLNKYVDWWKQGPLYQAINAPTEDQRAAARDTVSQNMMGMGTDAGGGIAGIAKMPGIAGDALSRIAQLATERSAAALGEKVAGSPASSFSMLAANPNPMPLVPTIKAYHGSPYDFDAFDPSKIGTGEGAQAYGHGLYFAGNENVARTYRNSLSQDRDFPVSGGNAPLPAWLGNQIAQYPAGHEYYNGTIDGGIKQFLGRIAEEQADMKTSPQPWLSPGRIANMQGIVDSLSALRSGKATISKPGKMYEVGINADPAQMLDWDQPLSQQPPPVQDATFSALRQGPLQNNAAQANHIIDTKTGADAYRWLSTSGFGPMSAQTPAAASQSLSANGVPGIKYLDAGSRTPGFSSLTPTQLDARMSSLQQDIASGGGDQQLMRDQLAGLQRERDSYRNQTNNYVVFDPSLISILRKYGLAGASTLPLGLPALQSQQQQ